MRVTSGNRLALETWQGADAAGAGGALVARGVCRLLDDMGYRTLTEMPLLSGRRADVVGLDRRGGFVVVEVKTSLGDLRGDRKWHEYLRFCDRFYFAVPARFPRHALPAEAGVIVADRFGGTVLRPAPVAAMAPATRRAQTVRFARYAAERLRRLEDPPLVPAAARAAARPDTDRR